MGSEMCIRDRPTASGVRRSGLLRSFGLCRFVYVGRMPSPILFLSGERSGILFGSTLIRFQTTFASRSEPRFSSTKIVKAPGSAKFICGGSEIILSGADFPAKLRAEWAFRRVADEVLAGRGLCRETIRDTLFRAIMYLLRGIMYGMRETIS